MQRLLQLVAEARRRGKGLSELGGNGAAEDSPQSILKMHGFRDSRRRSTSTGNGASAASLALMASAWKRGLGKASSEVPWWSSGRERKGAAAAGPVFSGALAPPPMTLPKGLRAASAAERAMASATTGEPGPNSDEETPITAAAGTQGKPAGRAVAEDEGVKEGGVLVEGGKVEAGATTDAAAMAEVSSGPSWGTHSDPLLTNDIGKGAGASQLPVAAPQTGLYPIVEEQEEADVRTPPRGVGQEELWQRGGERPSSSASGPPRDDSAPASSLEVVESAPAGARIVTTAAVEAAGSTTGGAGAAGVMAPTSPSPSHTPAAPPSKEASALRQGTAMFSSGSSSASPIRRRRSLWTPHGGQEEDEWEEEEGSGGKYQERQSRLLWQGEVTLAGASQQAKVGDAFLKWGHQ